MHKTAQLNRPVFLGLLATIAICGGCRNPDCSSVPDPVSAVTETDGIENPVNVALTGRTAAIRAEAIRMLPLGVHDAMLAGIARHDSFGMVRGAAVEKLTDAKALAEIAMSTDEPWIRAEATRKVSDKTVLAKLADDPSELVRRAAREALGH